MAVHSTIESALTPANLWGCATKSAQNVHALTILARVMKDPRFEGAGSENPRAYYEKFMKEQVGALTETVSEWSYDRSDPKEVERKIEELVLLNVLIYGVSGWTKDKDYYADFLL